MTYSETFALALGTSQTGLTLKAALVGTDGAIDETARDITAGFTESGSGNYQWVYADFADGFRGSVVFYTGSLGVATDFSGVAVKTQAAAGLVPAEIASAVETDLSDTHGAGSWATATGFSTHSAGDVAAQVASDAQSTPLHADVRLVAGQAATATETIAFDTINDGGTVVLPASATVPSRGTTDTIKVYEGETITQSITITDADGDPVDMSGKTIAVEIEDLSGTDVAKVEDGSITVSGASNQTLSFAWPSAVTASVRTLRYAIRDASAPRTVWGKGKVEVSNATEDD